MDSNGHSKSRFISPWAHIKRPITTTPKATPAVSGLTTTFKEKSIKTRPSSSNGQVKKSKIAVSKLMLKTVETVKSISYLDAQPSLLASSLEERSFFGDHGSITQSQINRSHLLDADSFANISFDSARLTSRTPMEMLTLISARVQENRDPPPFVSQVHDLPPSSLSWDERPTLKRLEASNPPVNIIGCNHSLDLILAKADWRARQIQKVNEIRVEKSEQRLKDLQEEIVFKQGRAARYAATMELQQKQIAWMKFLVLLRYVRDAKENFDVKKAVIRTMQRNTRSILIIKKVIRKWYRYRIFQKYAKHLHFRGVINLPLLIRIRRKVRATNIIKKFLRENRYSGKRLLSIVYRFNRAVHLVQRHIRIYLAGRRAQLHMVEQLWLTLEMSHLRKLMEKQKKSRAPRTNLNLLDLRSKETMTKQASKWAKCDADMEAAIGRLRARRILRHRTEEEELERLLLPAEVRRQHLHHLVFHLRKDFYKQNRAMVALERQREKEKDKRGFNELDALDMLCGRNVDRIYSTISGMSLDEMAEKHGGPHAFSAAMAKSSGIVSSSSSSSTSSAIVLSHARATKAKALIRKIMIRTDHVPFRLFRTFAQPEQRDQLSNLIKELHDKQRAIEPFEFEH